MMAADLLDRYFDIVDENDDPRLAALRHQMSDADLIAVIRRYDCDYRQGHHWVCGPLVRLLATLLERGRTENFLRYELELGGYPVEAAYAFAAERALTSSEREQPPAPS